MMTQKLDKLMAYCEGIYRKEDGEILYKKYLNEIKSITPEELITIQNTQSLTRSSSEMLNYVDKLINVFYESLNAYRVEGDIPIFIEVLLSENDQLTEKLEVFKEMLKNIMVLDQKIFISFLETLEQYNVHLEKLENILFSQLEKLAPHFTGLKIMWALHDKIRSLLKGLKQASKEETPADLIVEIGQLYFLLYGAIQKQNLILFPLSIDNLSADTAYEMHIESFEYGFCYIAAPTKVENVQQTQWMDHLLDTGSGVLEIETLVTILNILPIDFTLVDENDEVKFFNDTPNRIFPRSKSILGRNVRNCHPPHSVHVVENILTSFKNGSEEKAEFWIDLKGKMIYIYYVPIRDASGTYKGTLEISQEISRLRALKGEKRLLDWNKA